MAGVSSERADVIFATLPAYLDFLARILKAVGRRVFYLSLLSPGQFVQAERRRALVLREAGIMPLPLESLPRLTGAHVDLSDGEGLIGLRFSSVAGGCPTNPL